MLRGLQLTGCHLTNQSSSSKGSSSAAATQAAAGSGSQPGDVVVLCSPADTNRFIAAGEVGAVSSSLLHRPDSNEHSSWHLSTALCQVMLASAGVLLNSIEMSPSALFSTADSHNLLAVLCMLCLCHGVLCRLQQEPAWQLLPSAQA
jgi:hypothetical protein